MYLCRTKINPSKYEIYIYLTILLTFCCSCTGQKNTEVTINNPEKPLTFKMVTPPEILTQPLDRAAYLVEHYWDNFDFSDFRYTKAPEVTEQAFVDYLDILPIPAYEVSSKSIQRMLQKAEVDSGMFSYFTGLYEKYLYDPNSPFRNEEFYIPVLEVMLASPIIDDVKKNPSSLSTGTGPKKSDR
ncbi:MAG: DUF5106 domain-containing protein [Tannerellaceae bacterium]|nr:DUF5106 domain-containing protein [Tannerellaceae bacterium]